MGGKIKTPNEIWNELELIGKLSCWIVIPIYYISILIFYGFAILISGVVNAWDDFD